MTTAATEVAHASDSTVASAISATANLTMNAAEDAAEAAHV